jgi:hypothetical protein
MSNWKSIAAASIVTHDAPAVTDNSDLSLYHQLKAAIESSKVAERDLGFAMSLQGGFAKYGSFTERQRPHVERLIAGPKAAPEGPDAALGKALEAALPYVATKDQGFALSLLNGFRQYGRFSDRQRPYAESFANCFPASIERAPYEAPENPVVTRTAPAATPALLCPNICGTVNLNRFSRFSIGKLTLSLKNDGSVIWVKWNDLIAGSIDSATHAFRPSHRYIFSATSHTDCRAALIAVEADPLAAAKQDGVLTGRCSCCGRALTEPTSIAIGVGPICLAKF